MHCPLNEVKGIKKIFGKVRGKKIFVWAQSPGIQENKAEKELIGPSGQFLWKELARVKIDREDCDIQNVVRCLPADYDNSTWPPLKMRSPSKKEIKCCSIYNEKAIEKSHAHIHLVFGQINLRLYSHALDQIRLRPESAAVEKAELQRMCAERRIPGDFDIAQISWRPDLRPVLLRPALAPRPAYLPFSR